MLVIHFSSLVHQAIDKLPFLHRSVPFSLPPSSLFSPHFFLIFLTCSLLLYTLNFFLINFFLYYFHFYLFTDINFYVLLHHGRHLLKNISKNLVIPSLSATFILFLVAFTAVIAIVRVNVTVTHKVSFFCVSDA